MSPDTAIASITLAKTPLAGAGRHGFVIGLAGWSGSGKTTLAEQLICVLTARGRDVATIKHAHHRFDADVPGKDSHRHRSCPGAQATGRFCTADVFRGRNRTIIGSSKESLA